MANNLAIGIGGSGARCTEALIYLSAAGLGPPDLETVFVDADTNNGNLESVLKLAKLYRQLQPGTADEFGATPFLRTRLVLTSERSWSPFPAGENSTVATHFGHAQLQAARSQSARVLEALYSKDQRDADLAVGFRGQPSIGAAVFANTVNARTEPWAGLIGRMNAALGGGAEYRVFALGSLFGGTGAAGLPTIPRLLRSSVAAGKGEIHLGAALLLPYFSFPVPSKTNEKVFASPELFVLNSKEALRYYGGLEGQYRRFYVAGAPKSAEQRTFALGGAQQRNLPHFVELVGGLAALDFFGDRTLAPGIKVLATGRPETFEWEDVPNYGEVRTRLGNLARLSFFYLKEVYPRLIAARNGEPGSYRIPWIQHLFVRKGYSLASEETMNHLNGLRQFAVGYLTWLRDMDRNHGGIELKLLHREPIEGIGEDGMNLNSIPYTGDLLLEGAPARLGLRQCWDNLCAEEGHRWRESRASSARVLQAAMYRACARGEA